MECQDLWDQSAEPEQLRAVVDERGGCCWELCSAAGCLRDRDRAELMRRWSVRQDRERASPAALAVEEPE
jgi:hypothetical protein